MGEGGEVQGRGGGTCEEKVEDCVACFLEAWVEGFGGWERHGEGVVLRRERGG